MNHTLLDLLENMEQLPDELLINIFSRLPLLQIQKIREVRILELSENLTTKVKLDFTKIGSNI